MHQAQRWLMFSMLVWLLSNSACFAYDPNGVWSSSTGATINLWANMQQVSVTVTTPQGQQYQYNGWWTRFGDYFSYQGNDGTYAAAFNGGNQIQVQTPSGARYVWTRGQPVAPPPPPPANNANANISGLWASSSGSSVQVSTQGNQIFVTLIDRAGRRYQGSGRWLQIGYSFDYSIPEFPGVAYCTVVNANQINILYGQKATTWYRQ